MLLIKDGRLCVAGVSFGFPNGLYLDTLAEVENPNGIELKNESEKVTVDVYAFNNQYSSKDSLERMLDDKEDGFNRLEEVAPVSINGLIGHSCRYKDKSCEYYEVIFDLAENADNINAFSICVHAEKDFGIEKALAIPAVKSLIGDIRKD